MTAADPFQPRHQHSYARARRALCPAWMAAEAVHHGFAGRGGCRGGRRAAPAVALSPDSSAGPVAGAGSSHRRNTAGGPADTAPGPFPGRVASTVPAIDVAAMATRHGIAAATIVTLLPCGLLLRRQIAVRIAEAIARAQIPAMIAWRRMGGYTVLHGLRQHRCSSTSRRHAQLNGQCGGGNADDLGPSPIKPEAAGVFTTR